MLTRALRYFCHVNGASLLYTKAKDKPTMTTLRNMLYHHTFSSSPIDGRLLQLSHDRPLVIPASADSFAGMGKPPTIQGVISDLTADKWKAVYEEYFPPREEKSEKQDLNMVEAEQFAEEAIDDFVATLPLDCSREWSVGRASDCDVRLEWSAVEAALSGARTL